MNLEYEPTRPLQPKAAHKFMKLPFLLLFLPFLLHAETLPPLKDGKAPQNYEELWAGFDPLAEPLDTEILKEWEEDGVVLRVVRFRVGVFKGKKAMLAGVYGFPKGGKDLPGLLNIHGGGQYADANSVLTNAKRGYATVTIAWAGRISSSQYRVTPNEVKLFWDGKTDDSAYKVTTDWGALDAYHAPIRFGKDAFASIPGGSEYWTLDDVSSPRNNSWFLCTLGARRALTFLQRQPEVDCSRLGVYGHSMGGKLTVATAAADNRVKAAAPSCGGISDRYNDNPLHHNTVGDSPALRHLSCPTLFLSPANDFHGHINNLPDAIRESTCTDWRVTCSAHLNHRDNPEGEVASQLWFDQWLKGSFQWPSTPVTRLEVATPDGIPLLTVRPDSSRPVLGVEVYYTQQGKVGKEHRINRINQFWHFAPSREEEGTWTAKLPLSSIDNPLWAYANVRYQLDKPITGAGYYYGTYTTEQYNLSSLVEIVSPAKLQAAKVKATLKPSYTIEAFQGDWRKEWYHYSSDGWGMRTHKLFHPLWKAPADAKLSFEILSGEPNKLVVGLDQHAAEVQLSGGKGWQTVTLSPSDFLDVGNNPMESWGEPLELRILAAEHLRAPGRGKQETRLVGANWKGSSPEFRNMRWVVGD